MGCEKIAASQRVAASVCEAKLVGTKKELAACMGAENMLKQEGASLAHLVECARCKAQMTHIKTKFQGVAGYLKANANKWQKKDKLANLETSVQEKAKLMREYK